MQKQILVTGCFLLTFMLPTRATAATFNEIYVFGDSLSDTENLFNATGKTFPPAPYYDDGRFSNGPLWVEYLAQDLKLTLNPNNNFAVSGSSTGLNNAVRNDLPLPGLLAQVNNFTAPLTANKQSVEPNALYIVWAGANDYIFGHATDPTKVVDNLSTAVSSLAAVGAKNILIGNLPDLGKLPGTRVDSQISSSLSTLTSEHNSDLSVALNGLSQSLGPSVNITPFDVNSLFNEFSANPGKFGFTDVTDGCIGNSSAVPLDVPRKQVVCKPDNFVYWDDIHPTTATHKLIADLAFSDLDPKPVPEPSSVLGVLALSALGAVSLLKRK